MRPEKIAKVNKIDPKIYLTEILLIKTFEIHKPNMYTRDEFELEFSGSSEPEL